MQVGCQDKKKGHNHREHQRLGDQKGKKIPGKCPQLGFMCFLQELAASSEKKKKIKKKEKKKRN